MNLLDILSFDCIVSPLIATDKKGVIDELVDHLARVGKVSDPRALKDAVWTREQTRTTGVGLGLAIPHGKCACVSSVIMAIGRPAKPMDFEAIDGQPVQLIALLASPPDRASDHIQALARITRFMMMDEFRQRMYASTTPKEIYELLKSQEKPA